MGPPAAGRPLVLTGRNACGWADDRGRRHHQL